MSDPTLTGRPRRARAVLAGTALGCAALVAVPAASADAAATTRTGPSAGGVAPYVLPAAGGVTITSLLTVNHGAAADGTVVVGVPDGIGAYRSGKRVTALVNHELGATSGIARAHGQKGAFVSRWSIDPKTLRVDGGSDLIQAGVRYWDYTTGSYASAPVAPGGTTAGHTAAFNRFCSGYLAPAGSLYNARSGAGYRGGLYMANEEAGDEGRVFAVTTDGAATQLPRLGLFSWENTVAAPNRTDTTVVLGNEDSANGQLRVYAGRKATSGTPVERAGLTNGSLSVVDVVDETVSTDAQFRAAYGKGKPVPVSFGAGERIDTTVGGAAQNVEAAAKGLSLNRIEDGAFDPDRRNDYYFLTTEGGSTAGNPAEPGVSRDGGGLWRLRFKDVERPELGGTLTLLLDGTEGPLLNKPDNMTIDREGNLLIQEDPGGNDHVARIVAYRIEDGALGTLAQFDRALFGVSDPTGTTPDTRAVLTTDEESSGIVDTEDLFGEGSFLFDAQVHTKKNLPAGTGAGTVEELVENGQLLLLRVRSWDAVYGD